MRLDDLEELVHRELQQLPGPHAPETLLPRVLAAVQAWVERPWYARAWFTWPVGWQLASIGALAMLLTSGAWLLSSGNMLGAGTASAWIADIGSTAAAVIDHVVIGVTTVQILWRALVQPIAPYAFGLVAIMCVACGAFGAALNQIVLGRALQR